MDAGEPASPGPAASHRALGRRLRELAGLLAARRSAQAPRASLEGARPERLAAEGRASAPLLGVLALRHLRRSHTGTRRGGPLSVRPAYLPRLLGDGEAGASGTRRVPGQARGRG